MLLVLAHGADRSALWAAERLRARSRPVRVVLVDDLDTPLARWTHRVGDGGTRTTVELPDGRRLDSRDVGAVLNRVVRPPSSVAAAADGTDAPYARGELTAFAISWLRALAPRVVNAPTPQGLSGRWRTALQWRALAARAGLPVVPLRLGSARPAGPGGDTAAGTTVLTIGGDMLVPHAPAAIRDGARRLAAAAGTTVLGLRFAGADPDRHGWRFLDATPQPDLSAAGDAGVRALEGVLTR